MSETQPNAGVQDWLPEAYRADPVFANFKDVDGLAKSYKSASSFVGAPPERILRLPEKDDAPEWGDVFNRLGRPEKADGYGIKGEGADAPLWEQAQQAFHEAGLSKKQAERLHGLVQQMSGGMAEQYAKDPVAASDAFLGKAATFVATEAFADMTMATLKKEWAAEFDGKFHVADAMTKKYGLTDPDIAKLFTPPDAGGYGLANLPGFVKLLAAMGADMAEPPALIGGAGGGSGGNAQSGQARLNTLKADPDFTKRLRSGDPKAKADWEAAIVAAHGAIP